MSDKKPMSQQSVEHYRRKKQLNVHIYATFAVFIYTKIYSFLFLSESRQQQIML